MKKDILHKILYGISVLIFLLVFVFMLISFNVNKDYGNGIFGYKIFIVMSDSMKPKFSAGDIVFTKVTDTNTLKEGDIITFYVGDGTVVTHQIYALSGGKFVTKGINVDKADGSYVYPSMVVGKYIFSVPEVGHLIMSLRSKIGFILFIIIPVLILLAFSSYNLIKDYKKYKKEKVAAAQAKALLLNKEVEKNKKLAEELQKLKEQLGINEGSTENKSI